jgi:hypothetical protein
MGDGGCFREECSGALIAKKRRFSAKGRQEAVEPFSFLIRVELLLELFRS